MAKFLFFSFLNWYRFSCPQTKPAPVKAAQPAASPAALQTSAVSDLDAQITQQGDLVRSLKTEKADKAKIDQAVKVLLELKKKYKDATGQVSQYKSFFFKLFTLLVVTKRVGNV